MVVGKCCCAVCFSFVKFHFLQISHNHLCLENRNDGLLNWAPYVKNELFANTCQCRNALIELAIGLRAKNLPVLVVLEIHAALCEIVRRHEVKVEVEAWTRTLPARHVAGAVAWAVAARIKHYLD